jgi:DNA-binding NarL/FixJ family response regulator
MFREALKSFLDAQPGLRVIAQSSTSAEALARSVRTKADVILMDADTPDISGSALLRDASGHVGKGAHLIILVNSSERAEISTAVALGARGLVPKNSTVRTLMSAVRAVAAGKQWMGSGTVDDLESELRSLLGPNGEITDRKFGLTTRELQNCCCDSDWLHE